MRENQIRSYQTKFEAKRADDTNDMYIEGYFAVFGKETELWPGAYEEISPSAFNETFNNDIRALINHDTTLVIGRNKANTLQLKTDNYGLWGRIAINQNDSDALNIYERIKRGDVDQCSFGFNVLEETTDFREDGTVKWTLNKIDLHEVSICTFPAYEETGVAARKKDFEVLRQKKLEVKKQELREKVEKWH